MEIENIRLLLSEENEKAVKSDPKLSKAYKRFRNDVEKANWISPPDIKMTRPKADKLHSDGIYVDDITGDRRVLYLVELEEEVVILLEFLTHDEYDKCINNNKDTAKKYFKSKGWIAP